MMTGQIWTSDFCEKSTHFFIKEKVLNGKKIYDQASYFYISKKPVKMEVNRLSGFREILFSDL